MTVNRAFEAVRRFAKTGWLAGRFYYLDTDKAHFEAEMAEAFGKAKPLSDFLGMLVRLTFAMAFVRYCFATPSVPRSYWQQGLRQTAGGVGVMITGYFGIQISRVIFAYFMRDMAVHRIWWVRALSLVVALYFYWAATTTIWQLAESLASATKLVPWRR
jgi:hypothetical protein